MNDATKKMLERRVYRLATGDEGPPEMTGRALTWETAVIFCDARRARGEDCVVVDRDNVARYPASRVIDVTVVDYGKPKDA